LEYPVIIQGGMGIGVSSWPLANVVSRLGQLGVVSGTVLDVFFARRLQDGDAGGHLRRALDHFPVPELAQKVLERYFIAGGKAADAPYKTVPQYSVNISSTLRELSVIANFVEIWLAKEGHDRPVGINYMEKIQLPNLTSMYGAMLAGVDYVLMGAGIPREIPGILDRLAGHHEVSLRLDVEGASATDDFRVKFNPRELIAAKLPDLRRPDFLPIIASTVLATTLAKKATGRVDGFVIEGPTAGGHNAPPRGELRLDEKGEPVYGPRDAVDLDKVAGLGLPFWLAGGYADPARVEESLSLGARGVQIGTCFALTRESTLADEIKKTLIKQSLRDEARVVTDPIASPTGFPFKVAQLPGSLSEKEVYEARPRICDLGYLRQGYKKADGSVGYRCPAEPVDDYVRKGGNIAETVGRKCLCNGLISNLGHAQRQKNGYVEPPIVTAGDDINTVKRFVKNDDPSYSAADVIDFLLSRVKTPH
jgi:nitronate monooxygenase